MPEDYRESGGSKYEDVSVAVRSETIKNASQEDADELVRHAHARAAAMETGTVFVKPTPAQGQTPVKKPPDATDKSDEEGEHAADVDKEDKDELPVKKLKGNIIRLRAAQYKTSQTFLKATLKNVDETAEVLKAALLAASSADKLEDPTDIKMRDVYLTAASQFCVAVEKYCPGLLKSQDPPPSETSAIGSRYKSSGIKIKSNQVK